MSPSGVVITGVGTVSPLGTGAAFWSNLLEGAAPTAGAPRVREEVPVPELVHMVEPDREAERLVAARALRKVSDHTARVTIATAIALDDAGLTDAAHDETGVALGTAFGSSDYHLEYHEALRRKGVVGASALLFTQSVFNAAPGHIGQVFGLRGSNLTFVGGEAVGLEAVARAAARVRAGSDTAILAGGGEQYADLVHASLHQSALVGSEPGAPGPFAEGAAIVVVEDRAAANSRGVEGLVSVLGVGHVRGGECAARALRRALDSASLNPEDVDLAIACPPASVRADRVVAGLASVVDAPIATPTSIVGEGFAFTSALAATIGALSIRDRVVPPSRVGESGRPAEIERGVVVAMTSRDSAVALVLGRSK